MSKAFWEGFCVGFVRSSKYGVPIAFAFVLGLYMGNASHPYEQCKNKYDTPEDIIECVWIKENSQ